VAAEATSEYAEGAIVRKVTVSSGSNSISVPAIKYHVYVTNYTPKSSLDADKTTNQEDTVKAIEDNLPQSSTTLYLFGESDADFSSTTSTANVTVQMTNHYAAVCVASNYVKGVTNTDTDTQTSYSLDSTNLWWYIYVKVPTTTATTNFTITVRGLSESGIADGSTRSFAKEISADNIYQYTINETGGLIITVNAFDGVTPTTIHYHVDSNGNLVKDN
jgi:hypothetical protein